MQPASSPNRWATREIAVQIIIFITGFITTGLLFAAFAPWVGLVATLALGLVVSMLVGAHKARKVHREYLARIAAGVETQLEHDLRHMGL